MPQRHTADSLLDAAVSVFIRKGFDGASMSDIAESAGISKSSIYHHFAGKEALLAAATARALDALEAVLGEPDARSGSPARRLRHVVRRTAEILVAELPYVTLLLRVRGNTPVEQELLARRRRFDRAVAALVAEAAAAGELRADVDPRLATRLVFGMINSVVEWYRAQHSQGAGEVVDGVEKIVFGGLGA